MNPVWFLYGAATLFGLGCLIVPKLALFAILLNVIALAAATRETGRPRLVRTVLALSMSVSVLGTIRFVLVEAMPGIIEARGRDSSAKAVSFLREILFAEDAMRKNALFDPDADGIGSAALLGELSGATPVRGGKKLEITPLAPRHAPRIPTRSGPALLDDGYLFLVCLPTPDGKFSAEPSSPVDDERAERRYLAYAWPESEGGPSTSAYVLDEHERILEDKNLVDGKLRLVGPGRSPSCLDALEGETAARYAAWRGKKARESLPGDHP